jgi:hypothetical protein
MFCEPDEVQAKRRAAAARVLASNTWKPLGEFMGRVTLDTSGEDAIRAFYAEAHSAFEQLVDATGGVKPALRLAARISKKGVDVALREANLTAETLDSQARAKLTRPP